MTTKQSQEQPTDQFVDTTKMVPTTLSEERLREALEAGLACARNCPLNTTYHERVITEALGGLPSLLRAAEQMARYQWQPIESAPKNQKVIAGYHNCLGKWRTITACYYVHGTLEAEDCSGAEFAKEGWYEESDSHETLLMTDCPPTHWMALPPAPEKGGKGESDYAPYCQYCGANEKQFCKCGPISKNH